MTGAELKLMREYRKMEREYEDLLMTEINDDISNFIDEIGFQKYFPLQKTSRELKILMDKVTDRASLNIYARELKDGIEKFYKERENSLEYFENHTRITKEVLTVITPKMEAKTSEIVALQCACSRNGYSKTSYNIQFGIKKLGETMFTLLNNMINESAEEYIKLIMDEQTDTLNKLCVKIEEWKSYYDKDTEVEHKKLEKILDCYDMDSILREQKYIPIRQKGSHLIYKKENARPIPVPQHKTLNKELGYGIQREILENK